MVRLDPAAGGNGYKIQRISAAESYFFQRYPALREGEILGEERDRQIQGELLLELEETNGVLGTSVAALCLRCYLSYFILFACQELVRKFSDRGTRFELAELLARVLTDDGKIVGKSGGDPPRESRLRDRFERESLQILQDYLKRERSQRKSLGGWTYLRIRQSRKIESFLLQRGIYLESNWGILNATSVTALKSVLEENTSRLFCTLSQIDRAIFPEEVTYAISILQSYHTIYRGDRRKKRQHGRCQPPTESQQDRIIADLQLRFKIELSPPILMSQLQAIAQQLRNYRIACENPMTRSESLDAIDPSTGYKNIEILADPNTLETSEFEVLDTEQRDTIRQFLTEKTIDCLDLGIDRGFRDLIDEIGKRSAHVVALIKPALQLLYCDRISQTEVAKKLKLTQSQVSRKIKPLAPRLFDRARYRTQENLIQSILNRVKQWEIVENPQQRDYFDNLVRQVELFLQQRIFLESEANLKDVRTRTANSPYVQRLCLYLDRNREN